MHEPSTYQEYKLTEDNSHVKGYELYNRVVPSKESKYTFDEYKNMFDTICIVNIGLMFGLFFSTGSSNK